MSAITKNLPVIHSFIEVQELRSMRAVSKSWKTAIEKRILIAYPKNMDLDNPLLINFMNSLFSIFNKIPHPGDLAFTPMASRDFQRSIHALETQFGNCEELGSREQLSQRFVGIVSSVVQSTLSVPKKTIVECGMDEAVLTDSLDKMPTAATFGLGPCMAVIGYDSKRKWGFMIHVSDSRALVSNVEGSLTMAKSGAMLLGEILQRSGRDPFLLRVRGGISRVSEGKLKDIEDWLKLCNEGGAAVQLVREEGDALAKNPATVRAVALDTRSGRISEYNPLENPHSHAHVNYEQSGKMNSQERENWLQDVMLDRLAKSSEPEIRIVYRGSR